MDGTIRQSPVWELKQLRQEALHDGNLECGRTYDVPRTSEVLLAVQDIGEGTLLTLTDGTHKLTLTPDHACGRFVLNRTTKDGERAAQLHELTHMTLRIYIDRSSVEIFVNDGVLTFTERIYFNADVRLTVHTGAAVGTIYALESESNQY